MDVQNTMAIIFMNLAPIQALMYIISSLFSFKSLPTSFRILLHGLWLKYRGLIISRILNTGHKILTFSLVFCISNEWVC